MKKKLIAILAASLLVFGVAGTTAFGAGATPTNTELPNIH